MQFYLRCFRFLPLIGILFFCDLHAQETSLGTYFQVHISSPSNLNDNFYLPAELSKDEYRSVIDYKSQPGFALGMVVNHTINERWSMYVIPSAEMVNLSFSNTISSKITDSKVKPFTINHVYELYYLSTGFFLGYSPNGNRKRSLVAKAGVALHTLLYQSYKSTPVLESPSKFNSTFASLQFELGTRFIMSNNKPLELTFAIEADVTGYEAAVITKNTPLPNPSTLFTAGMRVHYFLFN